jgi:putative ABC transport system ATP-binding protein
MRDGKVKELLRVEGLKKTFVVGGQEINVLKGISLKVNVGDFGIIFGPSGCGKSTLLHTILGMEPPTAGNVFIDNVNVYQMIEDDIVKYRKEKIGVVYQQSIWIKSLNVVENVSFASRLRGMSREEADEKGMEMLKIVKLDGWGHHHPSELSSGQQQRVSLARALMTDPVMVIADEPTGNLDTVSGDELMEYLHKLCIEKGKTVLMVTHDLEYLRYANKLFHIIDGELVEEIDGKGAAKLAIKLRNKKGVRGIVTVEDENYLKKRGSKNAKVVG